MYFIFSFSLLIFPSYFCLFPKLSTKVLFSCKLDPSLLTVGGNPVYRYEWMFRKDCSLLRLIKNDYFKKWNSSPLNGAQVGWQFLPTLATAGFFCSQPEVKSMQMKAILILCSHFPSLTSLKSLPWPSTAYQESSDLTSALRCAVLQENDTSFKLPHCG